MRTTLAAADGVLQEDAWINQAVAGCEYSFANLMTRYKDQLLDMASRILKNRSEAEDVLQDSFVEVYRHLAGFNKKSRFSTWVYAIVLNRVRNHLRHNKLVRWCPLDVQPEDGEAFRPREVREKGPGLDLLAESKMELQAVKEEVNRLPKQYQAIFAMHYFQGFSLEEISQKLQRPLGTIKVYLHRARKLLHKKLVAIEPVGLPRHVFLN